MAKTTLVICSESLKITMCQLMLVLSGQLGTIAKEWTLGSSLKLAALPAAFYALQNWLTQLGYANVDSLTFNLLNQTKTIFAALCCFVVLGRRQTKGQIVALLMLMTAAVLLNVEFGSDDTQLLSSSIKLGILPILGASFLSGLSGAITQKAMQNGGRNAYLLSTELAFYGIIVLLFSLTSTPDGRIVGKNGFFHGWTMRTWLPVFTQGFGGITVGQVTKYAGSVRKGFALIAGIVVTAVAQSVLEEQPLLPKHYGAALLVGISMWMHVAFAARRPSPGAKTKSQ